jgi:nucleoside-diphosphate-sugar epimerase
VQELVGLCSPIFGCRFGDDAFIETIEREGRWDILCHHAADVTNYKSPNFDIYSALRNNTNRLPLVLEKIIANTCGAVLLTGSIFENDEGKGSDDLRAFSPYGLSKALTYQIFRFWCARHGISLGKFVIPNAFGPFEEQRFTSSLILTWAQRKTASINTPEYVRDNIHVSLLARAYVLFAAELLRSTVPLMKRNPSGYVESQGAFTDRFAREMRERLGLECCFELKRQTEFHEPRVRINTCPATGLVHGWDEAAAWDELAGFYRTHYLPRD